VIQAVPRAPAAAKTKARPMVDGTGGTSTTKSSHSSAAANPMATAEICVRA